jgi:hypothetical protein
MKMKKSNLFPPLPPQEKKELFQSTIVVDRSFNLRNTLNIDNGEKYKWAPMKLFHSPSFARMTVKMVKFMSQMAIGMFQRC